MRHESWRKSLEIKLLNKQKGPEAKIKCLSMLLNKRNEEIRYLKKKLWYLEKTNPIIARVTELEAQLADLREKVIKFFSTRELARQTQGMFEGPEQDYINAERDLRAALGGGVT